MRAFMHGLFIFFALVLLVIGFLDLTSSETLSVLKGIGFVGVGAALVLLVIADDMATLVTSNEALAGQFKAALDARKRRAVEEQIRRDRQAEK